MLYCCHCKNCQKITGSAFVVSATVFEAGFEFTRGIPRKATWISDAGNERFGYFCGDCECRVAHGQEPSIGVLSLRAGTFDDTSWIRPAGHIWLKSAQPWFRPPEDSLINDGQPMNYDPYMAHLNAQRLFEELH